MDERTARLERRIRNNDKAEKMVTSRLGNFLKPTEWIEGETMGRAATRQEKFPEKRNLGNVFQSFSITS